MNNNRSTVNGERKTEKTPLTVNRFPFTGATALHSSFLIDFYPPPPSKVAYLQLVI
jgi:hypothetical protein